MNQNPNQNPTKWTLGENRIETCRVGRWIYRVVGSGERWELQRVSASRPYSRFTVVAMACSASEAKARIAEWI